MTDDVMTTYIIFMFQLPTEDGRIKHLENLERKFVSEFDNEDMRILYSQDDSSNMNYSFRNNPVNYARVKQTLYYTILRQLY